MAVGAAPVAWPDGEQVAVWPGLPPGSGSAAPVPVLRDTSSDPTRPFRLLSGVAAPLLAVFRAADPDGSAMLVVPGGAYSLVAWDVEGVEQARWLAARGTTAFVLLYRLPGEGWADRAVVPLQDAMRAMRVIRARAEAYRIDAARVGVLGFSAGGHLAGSLATAGDAAVYAPVDEADRWSARPAMAALLYPVVSLRPPFGHEPSAVNLLGPAPDAAARAASSVDARIGAGTPPLFVVHANDDDAVDPRNAVALWEAARGAGVPVEAHLFPRGGHGFGVRLDAAEPAAAWPHLLARFAAAQGVFRG